MSVLPWFLLGSCDFPSRNVTLVCGFSLSSDAWESFQEGLDCCQKGERRTAK